MLNLEKLLKETKNAASELTLISAERKEKTLNLLANILRKRKNEILYENKNDLEIAKKNGKNSAFIDRLTFTEKNFDDMVKSLIQISRLDGGLGEIIEKRIISNGVKLEKIRVPLGVIGIIYESRPNLTIEVFALCFKSGNCCVLKGGSDALGSNRILFDCIQTALEKNKISKKVTLFLDTPDREIVTELLKQRDYLDIIIPRGGYDLVRKVVEESKIPVLYHSEGGARIYIDESADLDMALEICVNAKTSRPATCNSLDTVVVNEKIANKFLPKLINELITHKVIIKADTESFAIARKSNKKISKNNDLANYLIKSTEKDYQTEFLNYVTAVKIVKNIDGAIKFIRKYSKKHSEAIVAEDKKIIEKFVNSIDAAGIFVNCSTRLHDGGVMGFGAEMGIATGKLHARGPVGLKELTTYKWVAYGSGQIRI